MQLLFKQRMFSWFGSYDVYDEAGNTLYTVKGQLSWGHLLRIYDAAGNEVGTVKQKLFTWLPEFDLYLGDYHVGYIRKEFSFFKPKFTIEYNGWKARGNWLEWDYDILDNLGYAVATVSKKIWNLTDTYVIDVADPRNALSVLMLVLAIDAEKASREH